MKYADFSTLASRLTAIDPPIEGEQVGHPCQHCGHRAHYTKDDQGRWRLVMTHGPHRRPSAEGQGAPDIRPPLRVVDDGPEPFDWLNE